MRLIALDYGSKRVGVASTDDSGKFALPRMVLKNDASLLDEILALKQAEGAEKIVLGESNDWKQNPNPIQKEIQEFKTKLEELGIEVVFHPEVLTTMEARQIQGNTEMTDASAAALILRSYIERHSN